MTTVQVRITRNVSESPSDYLFRVLTDAELGRTDRPNLPMVFNFAEEPGCILTREWQYFIRAINPGMALNALSAHLHYQKAFTNQQGFGNPEDPRQNYLLNEDMDGTLPKMPKVFTCGGAVVQIVGGHVTVMDGRNPPPVKIGYSQPRTLAEAKEEIYAYTPRTHPHLFFRAVTSVKTAAGEWVVRSFPNAAVYSWYGTDPCFFMPHVAMQAVPWPPQQTVKNTAKVVKL